MADDETVTIGSIKSIESKILDEKREVIVSEPANYHTDTAEKFPVLYLLDGQSNFHHTSAAVNHLARSGRIPPMLIVGITNTDRNRDLTPATTNPAEQEEHPTAGGADNFLKFMAEELFPWVQTHYRTEGYRLLVGHSFGGLLAIHTLITAADMFNAYLAISPSLWWSNQGLVAQADVFFRKHKTLKKDLYMTMGNEGGAMLGGIRKLSGVLDELKPANFRWDFRWMNDETHGSVPLRSTTDGLEFIFSGWGLADPLPVYDQGGLEAVSNYFRPIGERLGFVRNLPLETLSILCFKLVNNERLDEAAAILDYDTERYQIPSLFVEKLARAYEDQGKADLAIRYFEQALERSPGSSVIRERLLKLGVTAESMTLSLDLSDLEAYAATYKIDGAFDINITLEGGKLFSFAPRSGQAKGEMLPMAKDRFYFEGSSLQLAFERDHHGNVVSVSVSDGGMITARAHRLTQAQPVDG